MKKDNKQECLNEERKQIKMTSHKKKKKAEAKQE